MCPTLWEGFAGPFDVPAMNQAGVEPLLPQNREGRNQRVKQFSGRSWQSTPREPNEYKFGSKDCLERFPPKRSRTLWNGQTSGFGAILTLVLPHTDPRVLTLAFVVGRLGPHQDSQNTPTEGVKPVNKRLHPTIDLDHLGGHICVWLPFRGHFRLFGRPSGPHPHRVWVPAPPALSASP